MASSCVSSVSNTCPNKRVTDNGGTDDGSPIHLRSQAPSFFKGLAVRSRALSIGQCRATEKVSRDAREPVDRSTVQISHAMCGRVISHDMKEPAIVDPDASQILGEDERPQRI